MARKCVIFKKTAKKAGKRISPRTVCFKRKAATPAQAKAKRARARKILKRYACLAKGAPKKACAELYGR